ncbi:sulfurtransferase [Empedobacter brevis]|uniref:rhodanese-like domain-containing protein n=1 Tax=Empedobacter brevis TaxID=247 RepID=UPI0013204914|nr:rhodanese-like domain-containing protein [Empedobacter brevis]QHC86186.1 sulfurtransferase [Empedobacter brevis]
MKTIYFIAGAILLIYISYRTYRFAKLDNGLSEKIENGAIILDVRTEYEYKTGHIDGSINIPLGTIRERYIELDTGKTYITTCSHGLRSVKVETILKEKGYKNVFNGGAWSDLEKILMEQKGEK